VSVYKRSRIPIDFEEKDCLKNIFYIYRDKNQEETDDIETMFSGENLLYNPQLLHELLIEAIRDYNLSDECKRKMTFLKIRLEVQNKI